MAPGADKGEVYVTNTLAPEILRLRPGAKALEIWASDPVFDAGPKGAGLDGIAFGADGHLYVNTFSKGELFRWSSPPAAPARSPVLKRHGRWSRPTACGSPVTVRS